MKAKVPQPLNEKRSVRPPPRSRADGEVQPLSSTAAGSPGTGFILPRRIQRHVQPRDWGAKPGRLRRAWLTANWGYWGKGGEAWCLVVLATEKPAQGWFLLGLVGAVRQGWGSGLLPIWGCCQPC